MLLFHAVILSGDRPARERPRYSDTVVQRKPLPLTARDLNDLARLHDSDSPQRRALRELLGADPGTSDAQVLHALLVVALRQVDEQAQEEGYRELAAARTSDDLAELRALRERRRARGTTHE